MPTFEEIREFLALKRKLFQGHMFVVPDDQDPDWIRYNELGELMLKLSKWMHDKAKTQASMIVEVNKRQN